MILVTIPAKLSQQISYKKETWPSIWQKRNKWYWGRKTEIFLFFFFLEKCNKSTNTNIQIYKYIRLVLQVWINWIPRFNFQFQQRFYLGHVTSLCGLGPHHLSIIVMNVNRIMVFQGLSLCFATFAISFLPSISNTPLS